MIFQNKVISKLFKSEIFRFAIVGMVATVVLYATYWLSLKILHPSWAYSLAYLCAFIENYLLTTSFTFKVNKSVKNGVGFVISNVINYLVSMALLNLFLWLGLSNELAPIPTILLATISNFLIVRLVMKQ